MTDTVTQAVAYLYENEEGSRELIFNANSERARVLLRFGYRETPLFVHQPDSALVEEMSAVIEHFNNLLAMREDCDTCTTWSGRTQDIGSHMADSRDTLRKAAKFLKALGGSNAD